MRERLRVAVAEAGGVRAFAVQTGNAQSVVSEAVNGGAVGPKLLSSIGLARVVTYAPEAQ